MMLALMRSSLKKSFWQPMVSSAKLETAILGAVASRIQVLIDRLQDEGEVGILPGLIVLQARHVSTLQQMQQGLSLAVLTAESQQSRAAEVTRSALANMTLVAA